MTTLPPFVATGQVIDGKYRVERVIGAGGMGVVVAAAHLKLGTRVALKFLLKEACASPAAVSRFLREGRALAQISSAHVARVMDVGTLEQGEPYLVLEYLEGSDLGALLKERGQLPIVEAVGYVLQACEAVAEAHANGIIHRDLKPSNLFLARGADGVPLIKVLDFGISKAIGQDAPQTAHAAEADATTAAAAQDTSTGALVGSPLYMAPEQIRNARRVDERTDVWGFGVMLYELVCGARPFAGETLAGTLAAVAADPPTPLAELRPDVPRELELAVLRCLEKSPDKRYRSVAALAQALEPFAAPGARASVERIQRLLSASSRRVAPAAPIVSTPEERAATVPTWEGKTAPSAPPLSPWRARLPLLGGLAGLALGGLALAFWRSEPPAPSPVPPVAKTPSAAAAPVGLPQAQEGVPAAVSASPLPSASAQAAPLPSTSSAAQRPTRKPPRPAPPAASGAPPREVQDGTADRK